MRSQVTGQETAAGNGFDDYGHSDGEWLAVDWREHLGWVEVEGAHLNVAEIGEGPPLVFVHGLSGCWQNWLENIPHFARSHRVIAPDLPGFGASPMPPWEISMPAYGRMLDRLCEQLGVERCTLVGNSMGGFVAAEMAIAHPERVERLVLVSAAGISQHELRKRPLLAVSRMAVTAGPAMLENARRSISRPGLRQMSYGMIFRHPNRLRPELLFEQHVNGVGRPGFFSALSSLTDYDFRDRLSEISVPSLVIWGANDLVVPPEDADEFERLIPQARKLIMEGTGHVPQMERPNRFNRVLERFIADELADGDCTTGPTQFRRPMHWDLVGRTLRTAPKR